MRTACMGYEYLTNFASNSDASSRLCAGSSYDILKSQMHRSRDHYSL